MTEPLALFFFIDRVERAREAALVRLGRGRFELEHRGLDLRELVDFGRACVARRDLERS